MMVSISEQDYVLVVPESSYSSNHLNEEPMDKSYDFISNCGQNSFHLKLVSVPYYSNTWVILFVKCIKAVFCLCSISPSTASKFCLSSAVSLSAFFNNGALPCACHEVGAESDTCESFGGQCRCRPNVIGRDCSMCATGHWGFPNCRREFLIQLRTFLVLKYWTLEAFGTRGEMSSKNLPSSKSFWLMLEYLCSAACNCGTRLCEPVTGDCICPPRTLRPECIECEPQAFGCHPLVGCEICNCSRPGVVSTETSCDTLSGQCR